LRKKPIVVDVSVTEVVTSALLVMATPDDAREDMVKRLPTVNGNPPILFAVKLLVTLNCAHTVTF
jgi:hypothetical protein